MSKKYQRIRVQIDCSMGGRTKSDMKDECDINQIMRKFEKNQLLTHVNQHQGDYGDFSTYADYHSSIDAVLDAKAAFASVPAKIRAKFNNDPADFLHFVHNPENHDEMVEMGLAHRRPEAVTVAPAEKSEPMAPAKEETSSAASTPSV